MALATHVCECENPCLRLPFAKVRVSAVQLKLVTPFRTSEGLLSHSEISLSSEYERQASGLLWCSISHCSHFGHSSFCVAHVFKRFVPSKWCHLESWNLIGRGGSLPLVWVHLLFYNPALLRLYPIKL